MAVTSLRMRVLPRFPAQITGTDGIKVERESNGAPDLVVRSAFDQLADIGTIPNPNTNYFMMWDAENNLYRRIPFQSMFDAAGVAQGYPTIAAAENANIPVVVHAIEVYGDAIVGDGLGGLYIDTNNGASETFMSGDGRTWYLAEDIRPERLTADTIAMFATAAQGALADTAIQPAALPSVPLTAPWTDAVTAPMLNFIAAEATTFHFLNASMQQKIRERTTVDADAPYITAQLQKAFSDPTVRDINFIPGSYIIDTKLTVPESALGKRLLGPSPATSEQAVSSGAHLRFIGFRNGEPVIEMATHKSIVYGLSLDGTAASSGVVAAGIRFARTTNTDDTDCSVIGCVLWKFTDGIQHVGRALTLRDSILASIANGVVLSWPSSGAIYDAPASVSPWANRALTILDTRGHVISNAFIKVNRPSGADANLYPLRGFLISNIMMDVGFGALINSENDLVNGIIKNVTGERYTTPAIFVNGYCDGVDMDVNLAGALGDAGNSPSVLVSITGDFVRSRLTGSLRSAENNALYIAGKTEQSVIDISVSDIGIGTGTAASGTRHDGNITQSEINVVAGDLNGSLRMIRLQGSPTISRSKIKGISPSGVPLVTDTYVDGGGNDIEAGMPTRKVSTAGEVGFGGDPFSGSVVSASSSGSTPLRLHRSTSGGVGMAMGNTVGIITVFASPTGAQDGAFTPGADNTVDLGSASLRWEVVRAGTGTINTSDARDKEQIEDIPDAWLDAWATVPKRRYKWRDAVREKGDDARWHIGVIAQDIVEAFEARGLDAYQLAVLCYDEWDEQEVDALDERGGLVIDENGDVVTTKLPAGSRYGVRYDQAAQMDAALLRRTMARLSAIVEGQKD